MTLASPRSPDTASAPRLRAASLTAGVVAVALSVSGQNAKAQGFSGGDTDTGIVMGAFTVLPTLSTGVRYDDNIYQASLNERSSWVGLVDAGAGLRYETGASGWELGYLASSGTYSFDSTDNYLDHFFSGRGIVQLGERQRLELDANYDKAHQDRGAGLSQGAGPLLNDVDQFDRAALGATYILGRDDSPGRLELQAGYNAMEFTNNRERTRFFDTDETSASGTFFWKVFPKSSLLLELRRADINFPEDRPSEPSFSSVSDRAFVGIAWDATAKTTGSVRVGYLRKDFDSDDRDTFTAPSWEVELEWSPRSYSTITLETSRYDQETIFLGPAFAGDFIDTESYSVAWTHDWSDRWATTLDLSYLDEDFANSPQAQQTGSAQFSLQYTMHRWLNWELGYRWSDRDSNVEFFNFARNQIELSVTLAL